jgi:acyl-coenzyme A thioesterase 13
MSITNIKELGIYQFLKQFEGGPFKASKSAAGNWMQYILKEVNQGEVHMQLNVLPDMCNPLGQLHGGIFALIMDEAVGLAFYTVCEGEFYTTVNLNVEHLLSAALGEELTAIGKVIRHGKKIAYTEGSIYNSKNQLICRATSNLVNTGKHIFDFYAE